MSCGRVALGLLAACGAASAGCEDEALVVLPPPSAPGVRSAILAVIDGEGVELIAKPIDQPLVVTRSAQPLDARIELLLYDRTLEELRLIEGRIPPATGDTGFRLPDSTHTYVSEIVAGAASAWVPQTTPGPAVTSFRTSRVGPSRCDDLRVEAITIPGFVQFVLPIGPDARSIVYGSDDGLFLMVDRDVRPLGSAYPPGFAPVAGAITRTSDLVLISDDGRVGYGELRGETLEVREAFTGTRTASRPRYLDGGILGDGAEVYALSLGGQVSHLFPTGHTVEPTFEALMGDGEYGGVIRMRSGSALVGAASSESLWLTDRPRPLRTDVAGGVTALAFVPGFGALVGTGRGQVLSEAQGYDSLGATGSAFPITGIGPFGEGGFMFGGAQGTIGYYRPDQGFCFDEEDRSELIPVWIVPRPTEWVLLGKKLVSQSARAAFVTVR